MKNQVWNIAVGVSVGITGAVSMSLATYSAVKTRKMAKRLGVTVDKLKDMAEVKVSETVINTAVKEKVDKVVSEKVAEAVKKTVEDVKADMHTTIKKEVSEAVRERSETIQTGIKEEYEKKLANIDIDDLKKEIKAEAKKKMMNRLEGTFDILVGEQSENLAKLNKIYDSIAGAITRKA